MFRKIEVSTARIARATMGTVANRPSLASLASEADAEYRRVLTASNDADFETARDAIARRFGKA